MSQSWPLLSGFKIGKYVTRASLQRTFFKTHPLLTQKPIILFRSYGSHIDKHKYPLSNIGSFENSLENRIAM